jgi:hypothetical protein
MHSHLIFDTPEGQELVVEEHVLPGLYGGLNATDEQIVERTKRGGSIVLHPGGTASIGKVVDASFKVYGLKNLRVVDASVIRPEQYLPQLWQTGQQCCRYRSLSPLITKSNYGVCYCRASCRHHAKRGLEGWSESSLADQRMA